MTRTARHLEAERLPGISPEDLEQIVPLLDRLTIDRHDRVALLESRARGRARRQSPRR